MAVKTHFLYIIMSCRKTNSCTRHKDLKPVTVDIQKTSHSYIINQVQIENEIGKGNVNWFNEASRQPVKHDTDDNSQATDTDIRLSQKTKASSQQQEQIRHDNCRPAITTISKKIVDDSCTERSPVNHTGMLLDSQFSTTSLMTAWMPPSLGRSPTTGAAQQYDSQYVLIKSLGLNDSTLSWTSSLATPNHNHDDILDKDTKAPNQAKKRCFSRMLFSPGIDITDEITELSSVKNSKVLCTSKLDINSGLSQSQTESETFEADQTRNSIKLDVSCVLEGTQDSESFKPLADVLSDFFDPPSKAAGRRRSAPSYRRKSLTRKKLSSLTLSKCLSQGDSCQDVGIQPLNEGDRFEEFKRKQFSEGIQKYVNKNCENQEFVDSDISKVVDIKIECAINVDVEKKEENTYKSHEGKENTWKSHGDKGNTVVDTIKSEEFSQVDLFCSTPIDVKRSYKSILSTSKRKTPTSSSTKRVRFIKDFIKQVDIDSIPGEIYSCTNLDPESLSFSQHSVKEEKSVQENVSINVSPKENENLNNDNNNTCTIKQETSREITDDLFSQVSPTVLQEMCSIVSDENEKSLQVSERESFSSLTSDKNVSSDNNADDTIKLPTTNSINEETLIHSPDITIMKTETTSSSNCSSVEEDKNLALERESLRNHESSVLKKVGKVKRFFYPTNSQINISCPKSVYGFKQHHEVAETLDNNNQTSIGTEMGSVAMTCKLKTSDTTGTKSGTPSPVVKTGVRNTKSTTESGFKRYSELIKGSESESRKAWPAGQPPSEFNSDSKLSSKVDVCTTPTSARRYSSGLNRRRLCLNENNYDKETTNPKQKLCFNEHNYKQTSNAQQSCDNTDKVIVSRTVDKSQNQEVHKVIGHKENNGMSDIDAFDEASFDELQDDSFAKEISMDGTLDKLSGSLGAVCNHGDMKLAADVGNNFGKQYQQNVEVMETKKSDDIVQKENYDNGMFQGFLTARGSKIDISKDKMVKAVKLLDSVELTDDLVVNHDRLNTSTCEMKSGSLVKINQDIDDELYRTETNPCVKHVDSKVELRSKNENIMMDPEPVNDQIKLNHERNEPIMNTNSLITLPISNSCSRPSVIDTEIKVKDDSDFTIRRKQLNNKMSGHQLNCGFSTASGKGMTCSMSSHVKAQDLLSDAESQNRSSDDNNVSMRLYGEKDPVIHGHIQDGGFSTASGNKLTCSALSLSKAQRIMKELECEIVDIEQAVDTNSNCDNYKTCFDVKSGGGFSSTSRKGITFSNPNLSTAEKQTRETEDQKEKTKIGISIYDKNEEEYMEKVVDCWGGFSTASGKNISCSSKSLSKAQGLMENIEEQTINTDLNTTTCSRDVCGISRVLAASNKDICFVRPSVTKVDNSMQDIESLKKPIDIDPTSGFNNLLGESKDLIGYNGFSTASGKGLKSSTSSLSKTQNLMKTVENQNDVSEINCRDKNLEDTIKVATSYGGFSTASGKVLKYSTSSLSKAQNVMKNVENQNDVREINSKDENLDDQIMQATSYGGFSTASGKDIQFSTSSLSKAQNVIKDVENQNDVLEIISKDENQSKETSKDIKSYGGFSTASGKDLKTSASSLSKAQNLLKNVENQNNVLETNCRDNNLEDTIKATSYGGFSTASGKDLKFSTTSLSKAQNLMKTVENQNYVLEINSKDENLKDEIKEANKDIKSYGGFSTASGKDLKTSASSLLKGQTLRKAVENNTDISETHSATSDNDNIKDVGTCRQLSSPGKDQRLSLSSETKTQESMEDVLHQNEKTKLATAKSKKEQFENIFNDLLNQNDVNSLLEKQKCVDEIEINLEKELEDMLRSKSCEVKVNKTLKPTKTSRFPPGTNIPKGFRPFKPPKIISKTMTNDACTERKNELKSKNVCWKNTTTSSSDIDNRQNDATYKSDQSKTNIADHMSVNTDHDQSKTNIADNISANTDPLDNTFLADAFSEDMVFSQNLSPRSDTLVRNISTHSNCSTTSVSLDRHAERSEKLLHCLQTNVHGKDENVVVIQKGGDCKGASFTEAEQEVDFKGGNSNFALEQIMDPENEFTQVLNDDLYNPHSEGVINTNIVSNSKIPSNQNSEMVKEIHNVFQSDSGESVPISETALESTIIPQSGSDKSVINSEISLCDVRKTSIKESTNSFQSASGKRVSVTETTLQHARKTLNDENTNPFQSASGKHVSVSETALQHARKTLNDENTNPFQSAFGKHVSVSETALQHARKTLDNDKSFQEELNILDKTTANPFQCASGQSVHVSDKALQHARETLKDDNLSPVQSGSRACTGTLLSEKSPQHARKTLNGEKDHQCEKMILNNTTSNSFQCASGKHVSVTETALQHARKTLNDENTNSFQCASGELVSVSETALQHARKTLNDENTNPFQSASGKSVQISDKALQHARETLKGDNPSQFHNSSGSCTSVLEKSPQLTKKTLNDTKANLFQSASGKSVCVSENALRYARQTALDENLQNKARRSLTLPENKIQNLEMSPRQQKSLIENKMGGILHSDKSNSNAAMKRKRVDFDDDFDIPVEIWEQMEMYGKRQKMEDSGSKQPLTTVPEDYSLDRQIPGFSPKPLKCQSFHSQSKRLLDHRSNVHQTVPPKSTFNTPYKSSTTADPNREFTQMSHNKVKVVTPVFVPKTSENLIKENKLCIQQNKESLKVTASNKEIPESIATDNDLNVINSTGGDPKIISSNSIANQTHIKITKEVVQLIQQSREEQKDIIQQKSKKKVVPVEGRLYQIKQSQRRLKLTDVISFNKNVHQNGTFHFHPSTRKVRFSNTALHRFYLPDFYGINVHRIIVGDGALLVCDDSGHAGKEEFYQAFLTVEGVDSKLLDDKWFYNHYRWVVWKLAAYEVSSPHQFAGRCLTPEVVMLQMKYRYDREIDKCQRSSIMKICEKDDTPCKRMVLCVSNIKYGDSNKEPQVSLTDGWYSINTKVDGPLVNLIHRDCIQLGHKLCISGAELTGSQDACSPLEAPESLMLKISSNSTRPAPWHSKLGYQTDHTPLCVPLSTLNGEGGTVGCVDVVVVRKYPTMYMEKLAAGGCIFRSYTAEEKYKQTYQQIQQDRMEKLYQQMESQFEKDSREERCTKRKKWSRKDIEVLNTGQEIYDAINSSTHPDDIQTYLSTNQLELLMDHQRNVQDEKRQKLNSHFQKAWNDGEEENHKQRNVIPLMKVRIIGCCRKDTDSQISSLLTIWRPTAAHTDLTEGRRYKVYSLTASTSRTRSAQRGVQLTATKQTYFKPLPLDDNILDLVYEPRETSTKQDLIRKRPTYGEIDVVGIVIDVSNTNIEHSGKQQDVVYVADINDDLIGIKFWGGIKYNGMADLLQEGVVCCCSNLCDRSTFQSTNLPIVEFSTELSIISQSPQYPAQRKHIEKLKVKLKDKSEYLNIIKERLDDKLNRRNVMAVSNISPEKINSNTHVVLSNSQTPNLKSAPKMAALLSYQSPSPLSPIVLSSSKSINKAFKPPSLSRK